MISVTKLNAMKTSLKLMAVVLIGIVIISGKGVTLKGGPESDFGELKNNLDAAIESRNFKEAKDLIAELFPLMKEDIKKSKKTLAGYHKDPDPDISPEIFEANLERKHELLDNMKHLVDASPAALRAKSNDIIAMIDEFNRLIDKS